MKVSLIFGYICALTITSSVMASEKLAQEKQCFGCHTGKKDGAAPSFKQISAQWKGKNDAESRLGLIIRQGSAATSGPHWNRATMPDQAERPLVSEAEARQLVKWVLSQ